MEAKRKAMDGALVSVTKRSRNEIVAYGSDKSALVDSVRIFLQKTYIIAHFTRMRDDNPGGDWSTRRPGHLVA